MTEAKNYLREKASNGLIQSNCLEDARLQFGLSHAAVEKFSLEASLLPSRYQRNRQTITVEEQLTLFSSRVAVVGCGGLGGYIIEELARLGVGNIVFIDPDVFEDHNLNRQLFSSPQTIGLPKVVAAARRVMDINPAVSITPIQTALTEPNSEKLLAGIDVAADAIDNITTRLELGDTCCRLNIPLVHAAIAGWYGHVCTVFPGDDTLRKIYQNHKGGAGVEKDLGNPAFTPAVIAGFQVAEICKILLGKKNLLRNRKLTIDLLDMEIDEIAL